MFSVDPFFLMDHMTISLKLAANFHGLSGCQGQKHATPTWWSLDREGVGDHGNANLGCVSKIFAPGSKGSKKAHLHC